MLSGLSAAEGGIETGLGSFGVSWTLKGNELTVVVGSPAGTNGTVTLPGSVDMASVKVDGKPQNISGSKGLVKLAGGNHTLVGQMGS